MVRYLMAEEPGQKPMFFWNWLREYPKEGELLFRAHFDGTPTTRYKITKVLGEGPDYKHYQVERLKDGT